LTADRRAQLVANLDEVRRRIARACSAAGREPSSVTLVAVTKTYPAGDVELLAELGITDVAENKDQEAAAKAATVGAPLRWHFVGQLQRNKAKSVVGYADVVESVDSLRLVAALSKASVAQRSSSLDVLIQISLDGDPERGGAVAGTDSQPGEDGSRTPRSSLSVSEGSLSVPTAPSVPGSSLSAHSPASFDISGFPDSGRDLWQVAEAVGTADGLRLAGVMAVAPRGWDPDRAFAILAGLAGRLRVHYPDATVISAGMSGDLEAAITHGATHVRIGTSLLGMRNTLR
jgi:PLP dependent protein